MIKRIHKCRAYLDIPKIVNRCLIFQFAKFVYDSTSVHNSICFRQYDIESREKFGITQALPLHSRARDEESCFWCSVGIVEPY